MIAGKNTRCEFNRLLQARNDDPEAVLEIDRQIQERFEQICAILVMDLSGFSHLTVKYGILHFLGMIQRMNVLAAPIVLQHDGRIIKQEADNLYALFPDVLQAIAAASNLFQNFAAVNTGLADEQDLYASIGIGYGSLLVVGEEDVYGSEMNFACKLGEDLARRSEILLTEAAFDRVKHLPGDWEKLRQSISGVEFIAYKVRSCLLSQA